MRGTDKNGRALVYLLRRSVSGPLAGYEGTTPNVFVPPYQMNPFNYNPLKHLLAEAINFERVRGHRAVISTTVQTAKVKVFEGKRYSR